MAKCSNCGRSLSENEMRKDAATTAIERALGGSLGDFLAGGLGLQAADRGKYIPNLMAGLAMKCNRCGVWICIQCAEQACLSGGAGMVSHSGCGGMFENPQ